MRTLKILEFCHIKHFLHSNVYQRKAFQQVRSQHHKMRTPNQYKTADQFISSMFCSHIYITILISQRVSQRITKKRLVSEAYSSTFICFMFALLQVYPLTVHNDEQAEDYIIVVHVILKLLTFVIMFFLFAKGTSYSVRQLHRLVVVEVACSWNVHGISGNGSISQILYPILTSQSCDQPTCCSFKYFSYLIIRMKNKLETHRSSRFCQF